MVYTAGLEIHLGGCDPMVDYLVLIYLIAERAQSFSQLIVI